MEVYSGFSVYYCYTSPDVCTDKILYFMLPCFFFTVELTVTLPRNEIARSRPMWRVAPESLTPLSVPCSIIPLPYYHLPHASTVDSRPVAQTSSANPSPASNLLPLRKRSPWPSALPLAPNVRAYLPGKPPFNRYREKS